MLPYITPTGGNTPWKPAVPLWGVVYGRIGLGILEAITLGVVVAIWSTLARTGLSSDQITGFAILATAFLHLLIGHRSLPRLFQCARDEHE